MKVFSIMKRKYIVIFFQTAVSKIEFLRVSHILIREEQNLSLKNGFLPDNIALRFSCHQTSIYRRRGRRLCPCMWLCSPEF